MTAQTLTPAYSKSHTLADSATMLRRTLRHALRYPAMTISAVITPVIILLLFVGVLGNTLGAGLGGAHGGRYVDYLGPGIILMAITSGCTGTSVAVCTDMTEGIVDRFRSMAISRFSMLTGHVLAAMIQTVVSTSLVVGVAFAVGFRPHATALGWLGVVGLLLLVLFALTWLAVGMGLAARAPEAASNTPLLITLLPFIGSAFVPATSMPAGVRWFAEYQPFTPIIETLRGLLFGSPIGHDAWIAAAWCAGIAVIGYAWARNGFDRERAS